MLTKRLFARVPNGARAFGSIQPKTAIDLKEAEMFGTFYAKDIEITKRTVKKVKPNQPKDFVFGRTYTDHMLTIDWSKDKGWQKPQIVPYGPMTIPITATSLHYGISCYEGLNVV